MSNYKYEVCGECEYFTGEECDAGDNEGCETYSDSPACFWFKVKDIILV